MNITHMFVLIPARNEEKLLPRCLQSLLKACEQVATQVTVDIILCVDSSTDKTYEIGLSMLSGKGRVIQVNKGNVGYARKFAADFALSNYQGSLDNLWMASTDADCEIPIDWLEKQLQLANKGVHGITGIVKVDTYKEHLPEVFKLFQKNYVIQDNGSHPHIHGANLGIRADFYKQAGGWSELATAEDHDLWNRLLLLKVNLISDAKLFVVTSGRKIGRAPMGFANKLNSYNGMINDYS